jgi:hypothetical protein
MLGVAVAGLAALGTIIGIIVDHFDSRSNSNQAKALLTATISSREPSPTATVLVPRTPTPAPIATPTSVTRIKNGTCSDGSKECTLTYKLESFAFSSNRLVIFYDLDVKTPFNKRASWRSDLDIQQSAAFNGQRQIYVLASKPGGVEKFYPLVGARGIAGVTQDLDDGVYSGQWEFAVSEPPGTRLTLYHADFTSPVTMTIPNY